ncbi:MAG: tripartite tricarboxylate transporter substrate binding protein [Proteobacteria bacterium]|nr:tripartite tricarboxylate transporter substrate binding protein [Pseudomonadota bacterium]
MSYRNVIRRLALAACALASASVFAQAYPSAKPVHIMVGANAGGGTDIIARMLAEKYQAAFNQSFIVDNRPGASNTIAADLTAKAAPDGYTLLVATNTGQAIAPHLLKLGFDSNRDLIPVSLVVVVPNVLVVGPTVTAANVRDLVAVLKAKPDGYSYGSSGTGSTQHLAGEAFAQATGTKIVHVPYKGSAQALADLIGGQIQLDFDTTSSAMGMIKAGKVRPLAVMSARRSPELPDVPTMAEAGVPNLVMTTWYGLFVTAGTPPDVVAKLHDETAKILAMPDVQKRLVALGGEPGAGTQKEFAALVKADYDRFGKLIDDAHIKIDQ